MKSRKIIFMRHGETNWNSLGKLNSFTDLNILEKSRDEILEMAKKLSDIDEIICSPMIRTQETAKIISKELGVPVVLEKKLWN